MDRLKSSSIFNCSICSHPYSTRHTSNRGGKVPLVLCCGHSACDSCISRLVNKPGDSIVCRLCSSVSVTTESYNAAKPECEFPRNPVILGQLTMWSQTGWDDNKISFAIPSKLSSPRFANVLCHECVENKAELNCVQCQVPYCGTCFTRVHQSARAFKDHITSEVGRGDGSHIDTQCSAHRDQQKQFWCESCTTAFCSLCLIAQHNGHTVSLLSDKNVSCFRDMLGAHVNVVNIQSRLKAARKKAGGTLSKVESEEWCEAEKAVREHFNKLHGVLLARENALLRQLYTPARGSTNSLKSMIQQIENSIQDLESDIEISTALIQNDLKYLNCASYHETLKKLKAKESTPCFLVVSDCQKNSSKFVFDDSIFELLKSHGGLELSSDVAMYRLVCEQDLPTGYQIEPIKMLSIDSIKTHSSPLGGSCDSANSNNSLSPSVSWHSLGSLPADLPIPSNGAEAKDSTNTQEQQLDSGNRNFDELVEGCKVRVVMTHAISPCDFYIRRVGLEKKLIEINQNFSKMTLKTPAKDRIKIGDYYMAQFSQDGRWYRSTVTNISNNLITVFYIDFGNIETVKRESLRVAPQVLMKYDGMALRCSLVDCAPYNGEWTPQAISTMLKIIENGELSVIVCKRGNGLLYVDLIKADNMDTVNLRNALFFLGYAQSTDPSIDNNKIIVDNVSNQRQLSAAHGLQEGYVTAAMVTHVEGPHEFYIQDPKNKETVRQVCLGLHNTYARKSERMIIYHPKIGMIVAAMNTCDNEWRRARIISVPEFKKIEVKYIDFGDSEVISYKRIRYLGHKFFKMAVQCLRCRLADIIPTDGSDKWSNAAKERFSTLVQQQCKVGPQKPNKKTVELMSVVRGCSQEDYLVALYKQQDTATLCINAALVKENLAQSTGPSSAELEVCLDFKDKNPSQKASKVAAKMPPYPFVSPHRSGDRLPSSTNNQITKMLLSQARQTGSALVLHQSMPVLPQQESRSGSGSYLGDSTASLILPDRLEDAAIVKPLSPKPRNLLDSNADISSPSSIVVMPSNTDDSIKLPVQIIKVVSPSEFYITPVSLVPKLKLLKRDMQKYYNSHTSGEGLKLKEVSLGEICVIKRQTEGDFCRAVVTALGDSDLEVRLPDFGEVLNVEKTHVYSLVEKFQGLRDGAIRCHLGGLKEPLDDRWPMTSTDEIIEFADKYIGKIYITKLGEEKGTSLPVEVLMKEEFVAGALEPTRVTWTSLNNNLRMRGLALSDGTIDWDVENYKYTSVQQQIPRLQTDVFKGISIPIKYAGVADSTQEEVLEKLSNGTSIFGSTVKLQHVQAKEKSAEHLSTATLAQTDNSINITEQPTSQAATFVQSLSNTCGPVPLMPKEWLPPVPFAKLEFIANPTNVNYNAEIFIQDFQRSVAVLKRIEEILDSECRKSLPMAHDLYWSEGQTCIARYHLDGKWYRGVVKSIKEDNTVVVELVDYGNVEECCASDLRKMPLAADIPIQGQFCKMKKIKPNTTDGKWTIPVLDQMHSLVVEKHCLIKLTIDQNDHSYNIESVKLPDGSEMLGFIVKEGVAVYEEESPDAISVYRPGELKQSDIIVAPADPDPVPDVINNTLDEIEVLSSSAMINVTTSHIPILQQQGEVLSGEVTHSSWVAECEALMQQQETSMESASAQLEQLILSAPVPQTQILSVDLKSEEIFQSKDVSDPSELYDMNPACLNPLDIQEEESIYLFLEIPEDLDRFEVEVGALIDANTVAFQIIKSDDLKLSHSRERFLELTEILQREAPLQPVLNFPQPKDACCAQFSGDTKWYRAIVLEVPSQEEVIVKYVDYGNIEQLHISMVREIKEVWTMVEVQSIEAKLHNVEITDLENQWKRIRYQLHEALLDHNLTAIIFERRPYLSVELYHEHKLAYQGLIDSGLFLIKEDQPPTTS